MRPDAKGSKRAGETAAVLERLTSEVRRILAHTENEPVGVLTAYRNAILRLADAVDRLAGELDSKQERH